MCDYVGSFRARRSFYRRMTDAGIEFRQFLKVVMPSLRSDINYRNHRKVVAVSYTHLDVYKRQKGACDGEYPKGSSMLLCS